MICYIKCACGRYKVLARKMSDKGYEVRYVNLSAQWKKEALSYKAKLPFSVVNGMVTEL